MIIHGAMPSYFKMKDRGQMCANVVIIIMTKLFGGAQIGHYFMEDFPLLFCYINHKRGKVKNVFILNFTVVGEPHCWSPEKNEEMGENEENCGF